MDTVLNVVAYDGRVEKISVSKISLTVAFSIHGKGFFIFINASISNQKHCS